MRCWKFVCSKNTEAECFQRRLFGDTINYWDEIKNVRRGDALFLYNIETDVLFGPFRASSDGQLNIERSAWEGRFPAQVRVEWSLISVITGASSRFPFLKDPGKKELRREECEALLAEMALSLARRD